MKWKDEIAAKELIRQLEECDRKCLELKYLKSSIEDKINSCLLIQYADYIKDRLLYDFDNNILKVNIGNYSIYDTIKSREIIEFEDVNERDEFVYKLFEESF